MKKPAFIRSLFHVFSYKEDADGIFRLQTVRYESLEVTQQMMSTSSPQPKITAPANFKYDLKVEKSSNNLPTYVLMVSEDTDKATTAAPSDNNILITIDDVDEKGNVVRSETVESLEIVCSGSELENVKPVIETS